MRTPRLVGWTLVLAGLVCAPAAAQEQIATPPTPAAPAPNAVAATVNGQPISEIAVQRGLKRVPPDRRAEARGDILDYLIENVLIDQYLLQYKVEAPKEEIEARLNQLREEVKKQGGTFEKLLQEMTLTEEELRAQIAADLRWDRYVNGQASDKVLQELFAKNPEMFDGTMVQARHVLLTPPPGDAQAAQQAQTQLLQLKQRVEQQVATELAKLPADADNLTRERARCRVTEEAFSAVAREKSMCPSKDRGGDLGWFPRAGSMVEPFAKAAFALKPHEMSAPVATRFGYHLILVTDRRPGKETKFDEIKDIAREVYADQLRDVFVTNLRPKAKIVITPLAKP